MSNVYIYDRRCGFLDGVSRTTDMGRGETTSPAVFSELPNAFAVAGVLHQSLSGYVLQPSRRVG